MDLQLLREFICLAEHLNFSIAAKYLFIAQPVLSRHIVDLENALGVQLFLRNKHSVRLTTIGSVVLTEAIAILARYQEGLKKIQLAADGFNGQLKIGFLGAPTKQFFPSLISRFRSEYSNIDLQLMQSNLGTLVQTLKRDEIDIGFTLSFDLPNTAGLSWRTIYSDSLAIVLRHDHPFAEKSEITLAALAHEDLIILSPEESPSLYNQIITLCTTNGFDPHIVQLATFPESALLMVESGIGIAILPRHVDVYANPKLRFLNISSGTIDFDLVVAWRTQYSNPAVPLFLQKIENMDSDKGHN